MTVMSAAGRFLRRGWDHLDVYPVVLSAFAWLAVAAIVIRSAR